MCGAVWGKHQRWCSCMRVPTLATSQHTCVAPTASAFLLKPGDVTVKSPIEGRLHGMMRQLTVARRVARASAVAWQIGWQARALNPPLLSALQERLPKLPAAKTMSTSGLL